MTCYTLLLFWHYYSGILSDYYHYINMYIWYIYMAYILAYDLAYILALYTWQGLLAFWTRISIWQVYLKYVLASPNLAFLQCQIFWSYVLMHVGVTHSILWNIFWPWASSNDLLSYLLAKNGADISIWHMVLAFVSGILAASSLLNPSIGRSILAAGRPSGRLAGILSGIASGVSSDILSDILA